jgi:hypothetical protein
MEANKLNALVALPPWKKSEVPILGSRAGLVTAEKYKKKKKISCPLNSINVHAYAVSKYRTNHICERLFVLYNVTDRGSVLGNPTVILPFASLEGGGLRTTALKNTCGTRVENQWMVCPTT